MAIQIVYLSLGLDAPSIMKSDPLELQNKNPDSAWIPLAYLCMVHSILTSLRIWNGKGLCNNLSELDLPGSLQLMKHSSWILIVRKIVLKHIHLHMGIHTHTHFLIPTLHNKILRNDISYAFRYLVKIRGMAFFNHIGNNIPESFNKTNASNSIIFPNGF